MKKIISKVLWMALIATYAVFSTGLFISIHHCCAHCYEKIEIAACESESCGCGHHHNHDQNHDCEDLADYSNGHHHSHDTQYFFKILDKYYKEEIAIHIPIVVCENFLFEEYKNRISADLYHICIKMREKIPILPFLQGKSIITFSQQRLHYA